MVSYRRFAFIFSIFLLFFRFFHSTRLWMCTRNVRQLRAKRINTDCAHLKGRLCIPIYLHVCVSNGEKKELEIRPLFEQKTRRKSYMLLLSFENNKKEKRIEVNEWKSSFVISFRFLVTIGQNNGTRRIYKSLKKNKDNQIIIRSYNHNW